MKLLDYPDLNLVGRCVFLVISWNVISGGCFAFRSPSNMSNQYSSGKQRERVALHMTSVQ